MTANRRALLACTALVLAAALSGCQNPFKPSAPEPPSGEPIIEDFSMPESVLTTMSAALVRGTTGRNAYCDAFADSTGPTTPGYYAVPDPTVADAWQHSAAGHTLPDLWTLTQERLFYDYLISQPTGFRFTLKWHIDATYSASEEGVNGLGTTALLHRGYVVTATSPDGLIISQAAVGYADLYLRKLNGRWYIVRWEDRVDPVNGADLTNPDTRSMGWRRLDSTTG